MFVAIVIIAMATLTPDGNVLTANPARWCLTCSPTWLADGISNVALFVPLGVSLRTRGLRTWHTIVIGSLLSLAIELLQASGHPTGRTPALADWLSNSIGVACGALVASHSAHLLRPDRSLARRLTTTWACATTLVIAACWWALSPAVPSAGTASPVTLSALPFTPGYGWYAPLADSASVNGIPIPHGGNGPHIAEARRTDTVRATVRVRGRDERPGMVPIVYVHAPGDTLAHLLLGQRGNDVALGTWVNATNVGLFSPMLAIHSIFTPGARSGDAPVRLTAEVAGRTLWLHAHEATGDRENRLVLSPMVGWALIQQLVRVDSPLAPVMTALWVLCWIAPLAYWATRWARPSRGQVSSDR